MSRPANYEELALLVSRLLDRQLDDAGQARLNELLLSGPETRRVYRQMVDQEVEFGCRFMAEANRELAAQGTSFHSTSRRSARHPGGRGCSGWRRPRLLRCHCWCGCSTDRRAMRP